MLTGSLPLCLMEDDLDIHEEVLVSIRQIIRAIDLHSKKLNKDYGLTSPQLLLMRAIKAEPSMTIRQLSVTTNMSQATATSILDRLEKRELVIRERDTIDKRKVHAMLTARGNTFCLKRRNCCKMILFSDFNRSMRGSKRCCCHRCNACPA